MSLVGKSFLSFVLLFLFFFSPFPVLAQSLTPSISVIVPDNAKPGEAVTIKGNNFGSSKGKVRFITRYPMFGIDALIQSWSNTEIKMIIPTIYGEGVESTIVVLSAFEEPSNPLNYVLGRGLPSVLPPSNIGLSISPQAINIEAAPGTTVTVFKVSSQGVAGFSFPDMYPNTNAGRGIIWQEYSSGITPDYSPDVHLTIGDNLPLGTYTGYGRMVNTNVLDGEIIIPITVKVVSNPPPTPTPQLNPNIGLMNPGPIEVTINKSTQDSVFGFNVTSTTATGFSLYGYPTSYGAGINFLPSSGGINAGQSVPIKIQVNSNVPIGTYTGNALLKNNTSDGGIYFPIIVHIVDNNHPNPVGITPSPTTTNACPLQEKGDADCNNVIDLLDFNEWKAEFISGGGTSSWFARPPADFNGDGKVDLLDFNIWKNNFH